MVPPDTRGDTSTSVPRWVLHVSVPVTVSKAWSSPSWDPTYTTPPDTAGLAVMEPPVAALHRRIPVTASTAYSRWSSDPRYTTRSTTVGENRTRPPVANTHVGTLVPRGRSPTGAGPNAPAILIRTDAEAPGSRYW